MININPRLKAMVVLMARNAANYEQLADLTTDLEQRAKLNGHRNAALMTAQKGDLNVAMEAYTSEIRRDKCVN